MESVALTSSVLVLNKYYMAVHVTNVKRAFCLLFKELAEVVSFEEDTYATYDFSSWVEISQLKRQFEASGNHDDYVRTVRFDIRVPRIIRLLFYDRLPQRSVKLNRRNIFARDENRCQYCGGRFPTSELTIDHVTPRSRGGGSTWRNMVCACVDCNVMKGGRIPKEAHMSLIRPAVKPRRSPVLHLKLRSPKYQSWKTFLDTAYWDVELK
jgi:5-methylcytosine-specific restriction endonuclease McrA